MAQKLILCEGMVNEDVLSNPNIAPAIADGMVVLSANGFATPDNKYICLVLLSEPAAEPEEQIPAAKTTDTEPASEGGEGDGGSE